MIEALALLLKSWKILQQRIVGTVGFSAHAIPIPPSTAHAASPWGEHADGFARLKLQLHGTGQGMLHAITIEP